MEPAEDREIEELDKASKPYLEKLYDYVLQYAPWLVDRFHTSARGHAGGVTDHSEIPLLEKMAITSITPEALEDADNEELLSLHHRLHQLWGLIHKFAPTRGQVHIDAPIEIAPKKKRRLEKVSVEVLVNAHYFIVAEMEKRKMKHADEGEGLDAAEISKAELPRAGDILLVKDYVSMVGSAVHKEGRDWDWLIRANDKDRSESFEVALARAVDPDKEHKHHFIWDSQGPHGPYQPIGDLVVRCRLEGVRELKRIEKEDGEGGEARADGITENWEQNWHTLVAPKGRFVYHLHVRGIPEDQVDWDLQKLVNAGHSVHGDLRLEGKSALWGITPFKGQEFLEGGRKIQGALKLAQPKEWLDVGKGKPHVSEPGGAGATSEKYAKFFVMDSGTYELGSARVHMVETFLHGKKLNGRYVIQFAPVAAGKRIWLVDKPEDQEPYAESHDLEDTMSELKAKGQKHLWWGKPGESKLLVVKEDQMAEIIKADRKQQKVWAVVLEPNAVDAQGDWMKPEDIEQAAHSWLENYQAVGVGHKGGPDKSIRPIESSIAPQDFKLGDQAIPKGAWILAVHIADKETWRRVESGELNGFSVQGFGKRKRAALKEVVA